MPSDRKLWRGIRRGTLPLGEFPWPLNSWETSEIFPITRATLPQIRIRCYCNPSDSPLCPQRGQQKGKPIDFDVSRAVVGKFAQAWNETDLDAIDEIFAPDYTVNGALVPQEAVKRAVTWLHAVFRNAVLTVDDVVAEGDRIAVRWTIRGHHAETFMGVPETGKDVALSGINIYRVVDRKIKENHESVDIFGLLQPIGGVSKS